MVARVARSNDEGIVWGMAKKCVEKAPLNDTWSDDLVVQARPAKTSTKSVSPESNSSSKIKCSPCELNQTASHIKGIVDRNALECRVDGGVPPGWAGSYKIAREETAKMKSMLSGLNHVPAELPTDLGLLHQRLAWVGNCSEAEEASELARRIWLAAGNVAVSHFKK